MKFRILFLTVLALGCSQTKKKTEPMAPSNKPTATTGNVSDGSSMQSTPQSSDVNDLANNVKNSAQTCLAECTDPNAKEIAQNIVNTPTDQLAGAMSQSDGVAALSSAVAAGQADGATTDGSQSTVAGQPVSPSTTSGETTVDGGTTTTADGSASASNNSEGRALAITGGVLIAGFGVAGIASLVYALKPSALDKALRSMHADLNADLKGFRTELGNVTKAGQGFTTKNTKGEVVWGQTRPGGRIELLAQKYGITLKPGEPVANAEGKMKSYISDVKAKIVGGPKAVADATAKPPKGGLWEKLKSYLPNRSSLSMKRTIVVANEEKIREAVGGDDAKFAKVKAALDADHMKVGESIEVTDRAKMGKIGAIGSAVGVLAGVAVLSTGVVMMNENGTQLAENTGAVTPEEKMMNDFANYELQLEAFQAGQ